MKDKNRTESFDTSWGIETHGWFMSRCETAFNAEAGSSSCRDKMDNSADVHADLAVQLSDDGLERPGDETSTRGSMSGASTDAYESDDDLDVSPSDGDEESSGDRSLEDVLGIESAQILRLTVLYTKELHTEIANAQALLNRLRTRLVRHSYGRNTCNGEDYFYSLYLSCQTKIENKKEILRTVEIRLDEIRGILALEGINLE